MRARFEILLAASAFVLALAGRAFAGPKQGPVAGTWLCVAHSTERGDMEYTLNLTQAAEQVTGNFTAPNPNGTTASLDVKNGSYKDGKLELHFDDSDGTIDVTGGLDGKHTMKGNWTQGDHGGTWECKRGSAASGK